ncbi:hypothetical protein EPO44_10820 [bacterium]|nr:MAG: hypothetical protein EPO44_10820 [bacterium]
MKRRQNPLKSSSSQVCLVLVSRVRLLLLLISLAFVSSVSALDVPPLRGRINDYARLMPVERARALEERLARFEQETGHQIAVLTIPSLQGEDIEGFSIRVAETWKIGQKGFDNGAILVIAQNDRKLRIEVGYGLEGILPDALASTIIREVIVPHFRANDYAGGIEAGVEAILKVTRGERLPETARKRARQRGSDSSLADILFIFLLLAFPIIGILGNLSQSRGIGAWSTRGSRRYGIWGGGFGGGFGGGGFGGGGGFSGGGGGFGGGGASGSW